MSTEATRTAREHALAPAAFHIERGRAGQAEPKHVSQDIHAILRRQFAALAGVANEAELTLKTTQPFGGFGTSAALERRISELKKNPIVAPVKTMDFTVPVGARVIGPPYDHSWATGAGMPLTNVDGEMMVLCAEGFSASGASVFLTSPTQVLASVTPGGTFDFSYVSFDNYPSLRAQGGLGLLVYENGKAIITRTAVLWTVNGINQFTGNNGSGQYADAVVAITPLGVIPLAPALINMLPGVAYEVWMWCWAIGQNVDGTAFLSFTRCTIPLITINAGPPPIIH